MTYYEGSGMGPLTTEDLIALRVAGEEYLGAERDRLAQLDELTPAARDRFGQVSTAVAKLALMLDDSGETRPAAGAPVRYAAAERIEAGQLLYTRPVEPGESLTIRDGHTPVWPLTRGADPRAEYLPGGMVGIAIDTYRPGDVVVPEVVGQVRA